MICEDHEKAKSASLFKIECIVNSIFEILNSCDSNKIEAFWRKYTN